MSRFGKEEKQIVAFVTSLLLIGVLSITGIYVYYTHDTWDIPISSSDF